MEYFVAIVALLALERAHICELHSVQTQVVPVHRVARCLSNGLHNPAHGSFFVLFALCPAQIRLLMASLWLIYGTVNQ